MLHGNVGIYLLRLVIWKIQKSYSLPGGKTLFLNKHNTYRFHNLMRRLLLYPLFKVGSWFSVTPFSNKWIHSFFFVPLFKPQICFMIGGVFSTSRALMICSWPVSSPQRALCSLLTSWRGYSHGEAGVSRRVPESFFRDLAGWSAWRRVDCAIFSGWWFGFFLNVNIYQLLMAYINIYQHISTITGWWFGCCHFWHFPRNIGNVIIPIDELIFFRGVAQPPTSFCWYGGFHSHGGTPSHHHPNFRGIVPWKSTILFLGTPMTMETSICWSTKKKDMNRSFTRKNHQDFPFLLLKRACCRETKKTNGINNWPGVFCHFGPWTATHGIMMMMMMMVMMMMMII